MRFSHSRSNTEHIIHRDIIAQDGWVLWGYYSGIPFIFGVPWLPDICKQAQNLNRHAMPLLWEDLTLVGDHFKT